MTILNHSISLFGVTDERARRPVEHRPSRRLAGHSVHLSTGMPQGKRKQCPGFFLPRWAVLKRRVPPSEATQSRDIVYSLPCSKLEETWT